MIPMSNKIIYKPDNRKAWRFLTAWIGFSTAGIILSLAQGWLYGTGQLLLGVAFLAAGSGSNLLDRVLFGYVRDFIPLGEVTVNAADLFLLAGTLRLLLFSLGGLVGNRTID